MMDCWNQPDPIVVVAVSSQVKPTNLIGSAKWFLRVYKPLSRPQFVAQPFAL